jgi:putative transposase
MYFVTICTLWRDRCLGEVAGGEASRSPYGEIVAREWQRIPGPHPRVELDGWIVMPDHFHGILILRPVPEAAATPLGTILGTFKSKSTKGIRALGHCGFAWQDRFHDHILKTFEELEQARKYIRENPQRWEAKRDASVTSPCDPRATVP